MLKELVVITHLNRQPFKLKVFNRSDGDRCILQSHHHLLCSLRSNPHYMPTRSTECTWCDQGQQLMMASRPEPVHPVLDRLASLSRSCD